MAITVSPNHSINYFSTIRQKDRYPLLSSQPLRETQQRETVRQDYKLQLAKFH